ncbi:MAG TPA: hypothetical protein VGX76_22735 [Pirellulales bacterium]|jgi:hypothetical protein|nr:hypothetical protein [Pirellulales bacterium]
MLALDLAYRLLRQEGHWLNPVKGGSLFYLPAWIFGVLWIAFGTVYTFQGK